ncbi:hypothetical protein Mgra_00009186 [Meloidogyne graminicola]|uniref:Uncharacterized protein n=1 Tax=Meloidogyne graminicola TaxID=189291 RepID=A0A8S9ZDP8_9BILA|nr:hypothetical protein Mgra_00009186 [Meloidogyne graminicola]
MKRNFLPIILLIGGSSDSLEKGSLSNCSLISINKQLKIINSSSFSLNYPRRSPSVFNFKCKHLFVIGGCSEPGNHLTNGELFKYNHYESFNNKINLELINYNNIEGFSCSAFCQVEGIGGFIFGGYNGIECLKQILKFDEKEPHNVNLLSPLPFGLKNSAALPSLDKKRIWIIGGWNGHKTEKIIMEIDPLEGHCVASPSIVNSNGIGFIIGGFDGINLRSKILIINLNNGKILGEAGEKLLKGKENCGAFCFCPDGEKEYLAIIGGWDGYNVLNDFELFEVLQEPPWLKRELVNKFNYLNIARNRPAVICINFEEND